MFVIICEGFCIFLGIGGKFEKFGGAGFAPGFFLFAFFSDFCLGHKSKVFKEKK